MDHNDIKWTYLSQNISRYLLSSLFLFTSIFSTFSFVIPLFQNPRSSFQTNLHLECGRDCLCCQLNVDVAAVFISRQPKTWSLLVQTGTQKWSPLNELISYTAPPPPFTISPLFLQFIIRSISKSVLLCFIAVARSSQSCGVTHNSCTALGFNPDNKWRAVGDQSGEWGGVSVCVCFVSNQRSQACRDPTAAFVCHRLVHVGAMRLWSGGPQAFLPPSRGFAVLSALSEFELGASGTVFLIRIFSEPLTKAAVCVN